MEAEIKALEPQPPLLIQAALLKIADQTNALNADMKASIKTTKPSIHQLLKSARKVHEEIERVQSLAWVTKSGSDDDLWYAATEKLLKKWHEDMESGQVQLEKALEYQKTAVKSCTDKCMFTCFRFCPTCALLCCWWKIYE